MRTFAVSFFSMHSNELHTEVMEAADWVTAAKAHSKSLFKVHIGDPGERTAEAIAEDQAAMDASLTTVEDAKRLAFDLDGGFDIVELSTGPASDQTIFFHDPDGTRSRRIATVEGEDADPLAGFDLDP